MKKILLISILFSFLILNSVFAAGKLSGNVKKAVKYMQENNAVQTLQLAKGFDSYEKKEFINWIQNNPEKTIPVFYMFMADEIYKTNKDEAVFWFSVGKLRSAEDVRMCKDTTNTAQIAIFSMTAPNTVQYQNQKGYKYILEKLEEAIKYDDAHPQRLNPVWACYHGLSAFSGKIEVLPSYEFEKIKKDTQETFVNSVKKRIEVEQQK
jgi:hypothetical protein